MATPALIPFSLQIVQRAIQMNIRFNMNGNPVGSGPDKIIEISFRFLDHQMSIQGQPRNLANRSNYRRANRHIGDKMTIHDIQVDKFVPRRSPLFNLASQMSKIRRQYRGRYFYGLSQFPVPPSEVVFHYAVKGITAYWSIQEACRLTACAKITWHYSRHNAWCTIGRRTIRAAKKPSHRRVDGKVRTIMSGPVQASYARRMERLPRPKSWMRSSRKDSTTCSFSSGSVEQVE